MLFVSALQAYGQEVVINEINYKSANDFKPGDWVELVNTTEAEIDLDGWIFKDGDDTHIFEFPAGTILNPGAYLVLCKNDTSFHELFPDVTNYIGSFGFGLSNGGELLRLYNADASLIDQVEYDDVAPWPTEPDGEGPTLELKDVSLDNTLAENWAASTGHGTPGVQNSIAGIQDRDYSHICIYPNPATNFIEISSSVEIVSTSIMDINGRELFHNGLKNRIDVSCLSPGTYFVRIESQRNCITQMFLKK
jgi:hypothetical protein